LASPQDYRYHIEQRTPGSQETAITMNTQLNFINRSQDPGSWAIFLFQRNLVPNPGEMAVAWKVIRNCGCQCNHPFVYAGALEVGIGDYYGNHSPRRPARAGDLFSVARAPAGRQLSCLGAGDRPGDIVVRNDLPVGAIKVGVYKDNRLLAIKSAVAPGQKAAFRFQHKLWIGAAAAIEEGQPLSQAVLAEVTTELSLLGIASADIVMTGGGADASAAALRFSLENIAMA
jgi:hypothetical protein